MAKSKPVRLLLTITADKMPEWHACLQSIDSGYVRAEMVRKGLKRIKPNQIQLMNESFDGDDHALLNDSNIDLAQSKASNEDRQTADDIVDQDVRPAENDLGTVVDTADYEDMSTAVAPSVPDEAKGTPEAKSQGGMAARMIQSGLGRAWGRE